MAEYIERKALLNALKEERKKGNFVFTSKWIKEIMENLPTADVAPRTEWISVVEEPPDEEEWVIGYEGPGKYEIVKIEKGIDEETRDKMRAGDINDPETQGWNAADGFFVIKRSKVFKAADVFGNNKVPYCWKTKSGHTIFGQNITWWRPVPEPPKESKR